MNRVPRTFYIACIKHSTEIVDNINNGTEYGDYNDAKSKIRIAKRIFIDDEWVELTQEQMINSFWHEYLHATQFYSGKKFVEEDAQVMANFLSEFGRTASY